MRGRPGTTAALVVAILSASAATAHEAVWSRLLGRLVGNTAWGVGLALAVFMIGMGAGGMLARRVLPRVSPRAGYVALELVVGLGALAVDALYLFGSPPSAGLASAAPVRLLCDVLVSGGAALVPAIAIGATYPFLLATVVAGGRDGPGDARDEVTRLYQGGLAGGIVGVVLAGAVLAPRIGFDGTALCASALNLLAALLARVSLPRSPTPRPSAEAAGSLLGPAIRFAAAGGLGLGAQVVWNRSLVPYAGVSIYSFALIVAVYLAAQACGFAIARRFSAERLARVGGYALALAAPVALLGLGPLAWTAGLIPSRDGSALAWALGCLPSVLCAVAPPALLLGIAQASALRGVERIEPGGVAAAAGWVSGVGTLISAVASVLCALLFYPRLGPRGTLALLGSVGVAAACLRERPARRGGSGMALVLAPGLIGVAAGVVLVFARPGPTHFLGVRYDAAPLLHVEHGVQDTSAIVDWDLPVEPGIRHIVANGMSYSGDSLYAQRYMRLLGHLPALYARGERRALVICVGTGSTAAALLGYRFGEIWAVDVSRAVRETLRWFRSVNAGLERDPRVKLVIDDGDRHLRLPGPEYDVITLEPPPPRAPGAGGLYTREFYRAARRRLAPGGVVAQWLPLHGLSGWEADAIARTFVESFPVASLFLAERNEAILLGAAEDRLERAPIARLGLPAVQRDLDRIGLAGADPLAETFLLGGQALRDLVREGAILRLAWPATELTPIAGPRAPLPLDGWVARLVRSAPTEGGWARLLLPAVPAFLRVTEGREEPGDRALVRERLRGLYRRDRDNPYLQYMLGFGARLESRLGELEAGGAVSKERALHARTLMARQRRWADAP